MILMKYFESTWYTLKMFYGKQGHHYDCFPWGLIIYNYKYEK